MIALFRELYYNPDIVTNKAPLYSPYYFLGASYIF